MINYPDMNMILHDYLEPFQKEPYTFRKITIENDKRDTTYLKAKEIDWVVLKKPFLDASLYDKKLDKHYKIDMITDTTTSALTIIYSALSPDDITQTLSIKASQADNKVQSVYAETNNAGFFSSKQYKLLYVFKKTIQIQEYSKSPFSKQKQKITTITFLN
jgi:hypothetical protein